MNGIIIMIVIVIVFLLIRKEELYEFFIESSEELPIYLISLQKDKERRKKIYKDVIPEFYYAVNGKTLNLNRVKINKKELTKGEIGCYLSHIHALKKAYISSLETSKVLILEDDAKLKINSKDEFMKEINILISMVPSDWEIIFLGHNYYESEGDIIENDTGYKLKQVKLVHGLHGYIVNSKKLKMEKINSLYPIEEPIDISLPKKFKSYVVEPKLIELTEDGGNSNTQGIN